MFIHDYWKQFEPVGGAWHFSLALMYTVVTAFGLVSNSMVLYFIIAVKKKKMVRSSSFFIVNLAIADILKVGLFLPMVAISSYYHHWIFGSIGCSFYGAASGCVGFVSLFTLMFMSLERFTIVKYPFKSSGFDKKFKICCILFIWSFSVVLVSLQFLSSHGYILEGFLTSCSFDYLSRDLFTRFNMMIMVIFGFVVPLALIILFYCLTMGIVDKRGSRMYSSYQANLSRPGNSGAAMSAMETQIDGRCYPKSGGMLKQQNQRAPSPKYSTSTNSLDAVQLANRGGDANAAAGTAAGGGGGHGGNEVSLRLNLNSIMESEKKVLKMIILNVACFVIAWLPYTIVVLVAQYSSRAELYITPFTTSLPAIFAKISSVYNPLLYTLTNKECRAYFKKFFTKTKHSQPRSFSVRALNQLVQ